MIFQLIADSGSTKTDWTLLNVSEKKVVSTFKSAGYNPLFWDKEELSKAFQQDLNALQETIEINEIEKVFFYGAGCSTEERQLKVKNALSIVLPATDITIDTDLMGAARGLLGKQSGVAAILGTGANSCLYRQEQIIEKPISLGYMLSDFGSGATLGLAFLQKLLTTQLSMETISHFIDTFNLTTEDILEALYKKKNPNTFCASFAPFIIEHHQYDERLKALILEQFHQFIQYYILPFFNKNTTQVKITGSIAHHFSPLLLQAFESCELEAPEIIQSPTEGLIQYHLS
ncbi:BadF/BadG/BcrA/BcrD ATPase family protein [Flammeovirga sp. SJP92]|uniref:BadF/BadG/BcrA/BcrD ATPase family protein n=1 Tax=Flammeovirga sp. SJP92 TaxID=1775430 RepID=UPI0009ECECEC